MAVGYRSLAGFPLGAGTTGGAAAAATVGFKSLFWWMGGVGGTAVTSPSADTPTGGNVRRDDSHIVDYFRRRKLREDEIDEPEKPPLEIVKIGEAPRQVITGLVVPASKPAPRSTVRSVEFEMLANSQFNSELIRGRKLRRLQQADDEWLMLN